MNARDAILETVRRNAPPARALPAPPVFPLPAGGPDGRVAAFAARASAGGARVVHATQDVKAAIRAAYPDAERVASAALDRMAGNVELGPDAREAATLDLFVCEGVLGVAENAAVWLPESRIGSRAAPFLAPHVAVVLERAAIVATMHDAYRALGEPEGFGVFVAGPSKTADIEQSLVIGAHGPVSLAVILVG